MDAVFFVVLLSIAVTALAHTYEGGEDHSQTAEVTDTVLASHVRLEDLDYPDGDRIMKITDVWALSILSGDGKVTSLVRDCFDAVFPWEDGYGFVVSYMGKEETAGRITEGWSDSVHREYAAEFGGTLSVTVFRYL